MMLPPPVEKTSSPIIKWVFRLLLIVVVFVAASLFLFSILSGTSDAHRHGLEQAMSDIFKSRVEIGELKRFNLFPQFSMEMSRVQGAHIASERGFTIGNLEIAFGFFGLLMHQQKIEGFKARDIEFEPGLIGVQALKISSAEILPGPQAILDIKGHYGSAPFHGQFELDTDPGSSPPAYRIGEKSPVDITFGDFHMTGILEQAQDSMPSITGAQISLNGEEVATGTLTFRLNDKTRHAVLDFSAGKTIGTVDYILSTGEQSWSFVKLSSDEFLQHNPLWAQAGRAWREISGPSTTTKTESETAPLVRISIKEASGQISGRDLTGVFMSYPDRFYGWWQGQLVGEGQVSCGLVGLSPKGNDWISSFFLVQTPSRLISADVSVNEYLGDISYRLRSDQPLPLIPVADRERLSLTADHACSILTGTKAE